MQSACDWEPPPHRRNNDLRSVDLLVIIYAGLVFTTVAVLSLVGVEMIGVYLILFSAEFFIACEFTPPLGPSLAEKKLALSVLFAAIFSAILIQTTLATLRSILAG